MLFTVEKTEYFWMGGGVRDTYRLYCSAQNWGCYTCCRTAAHLILSAETHKEKNKIPPSNKDVLLSHAPQPNNEIQLSADSLRNQGT